jgi:hypothetical protein
MSGNEQDAMSARIDALRRRIDDIGERIANGTYNELNAPLHRLARTWRERPWLIILAAVGAAVIVTMVALVIIRFIRGHKD